MNNGNFFLRISDYILVEYLYKTDLLVETLHPFSKYVNSHNNEITLVNKINDKLLTGNTEHLLYVETGQDFKAVIDVDNAFYYPSVDPNVVRQSLLPTGNSLIYDTIRIHIRSGYNFQDSSGILTNVYLESGSGSKVSLISQTYLKNDISLLRYNKTPIRISDVAFDKFIEYKLLNTSDIITPNTPNHTFMSGVSEIKANPLIFFELNLINTLDLSSSYIKLNSTLINQTFIPISDDYGSLSAKLVEQNNSYFEYSAEWDGLPIEEFIYHLNSLSGNDYILEHEISAYEQIGTDFYLVDKFTRSQNNNYNETLKLSLIHI